MDGSEDFPFEAGAFENSRHEFTGVYFVSFIFGCLLV